MSGRWIFVCGPSGVGKDTVLRWARDALADQPQIVFARRNVTRPPSAQSEDDSMDPAEFARLRSCGAFAWTWHAHGLQYGIGASYAALVEVGATVVVNGSREHAAGVAGRSDVRRILLTAPHDIVAERLRARGRDAEDALAQRLARNARLAPFAADLVIVNDGEPARAGRMLADWLLLGDEA